PRRLLCRPHSQGRAPGRPTGRAADQIRVDHQSQDREGARPRSAFASPATRRRGDRMSSRRDFITLLGGAAAWPLPARAQQAGKLPTIGFLGGGTPTGQRTWVAAFVQRLRELGWVEGRTVTIEYRWGEGRAERFTEIAAELVRLNVDIILAGGTEAAVAAKHATSVIPIVFPSAGDPIGSGLVASLARPGGNVTGLSNLGSDLAAKRLGLLREVLPGFHRLAVMAN